MIKRSKNYCHNIRDIKSNIKYSLQDSYKLIEKMQPAKFNESIDVSINIKKDNNQANLFKQSIILPYGNGKKSNILVLIKDFNAETDKEKFAADKIGGIEIIKLIETGSYNINFNYIVTTPDMMIHLSAVAKILGPKGLMPSPKLGTVTKDISKAIEEIRSGKVNIKADKNGIINTSIGRRSFSLNQINENFIILIKTILKSKPSSIKGSYIKKIVISTTMSPGINIDISGIK